MIQRLRKNYDILIDVGFWLFVARSVIPITRGLGLHDYKASGIADIVSLLTFASSWLLLIILVIVRPLRDEYAEKLWHQTATWFVYVLILLPTIMFIIAASFQTQMEASLAGVSAKDTILGGSDKLGPAIQQLHGALKLILFIAVYTPITFVAIYKWHRWRDAR